MFLSPWRRNSHAGNGNLLRKHGTHAVHSAAASERVPWPLGRLLSNRGPVSASRQVRRTQCFHGIGSKVSL
jgi:hypothetical protein